MLFIEKLIFREILYVALYPERTSSVSLKFNSFFVLMNVMLKMNLPEYITYVEFTKDTLTVHTVKFPKVSPPILKELLYVLLSIVILL